MQLSLGNYLGAKRRLPYPTKDLQVIVYNQTYEDGGTTYFRTSLGIGLPVVGALNGLDTIIDFSPLNDVRFDKSNATYWGASLNAYFYYDVLNPYHGKLKDFHYRELENQIQSESNTIFAKLIYEDGVLQNVDRILIYLTEIDGNNLLKLQNYILIYNYNLNYFYNNEWQQLMLLSYLEINSHAPYSLEQQGNIISRLNEDYVVNTFGPDGTNESICDFFMYFECEKTDGAINGRTQTKNGDVLRWNYGDDNVYVQNDLPAQTTNGIITVTSTDKFEGWVIINLSNNYIIGYLPTFENISTISYFTFDNAPGQTGIKGIVPAFNNTTRDVSIVDCPLIVSVSENFLPNSSALDQIRLNNCGISTTYINQVIDDLYSYYSVNIPTKNLTLDFTGVGNGTITTSNLSLLQSLYTTYTLTLNYNTNRFDVGYFIVSFDDGYATDYSVAYDYMKSKGVTKGVSYINGSNIGNVGKLTLSNLSEMMSNGWDIECHSYDHSDLTTLTEQQILDNLDQNTAFFTTNGLREPLHHAYPYNAYNATVKTAVAQKRLTGRAGPETFYIYTDSDKYQLAGNGITETLTDDVKLKLDLTKSGQGCIIFYPHELTGNFIQGFKDLIDYAISIGLEIISIRELYEKLD